MNLKKIMAQGGKISDSTHEYEASFVFFVYQGETDEEYEESIKTKDVVLDALDAIPEIDSYDVVDDDEEWNIECQATIKGSSIDDAMLNLENKLKGIKITFDYHYVRGLDTKEVYNP